jgi:Peptidase family M28
MTATQIGTARLGALLLIVASSLLSLWSTRPPRAVPETAPDGEFSSARAMRHVREMAQRPHPVGSADNARVREYLVQTLVSICPEVQLQKVQSWNVWTNEPVLLQNIVARLPGTTTGGALMLLCHYDSVPGGPGAGDDAAGVAAVLETLRAVRAASRLRNDLIVLITDAEEGGLLGAQAFVAGHPWRDDVQFVMNFEARGYGGPVLLMQTGHENGWIVREFARAAPYPFGSSFAEDVFRRMPNDTDFTIFRNAGKTGLNFAFFKGLRYYHTDYDTVANLDERSLQHHGSYCLALTRHFGNLPLDRTVDRDYAFFNVCGSTFVYYPLYWGIALSAVSTAVCCCVLIRGWQRARLFWSGIAGGFLCLIAIMVAACALVAVTWLGLSKLPSVAQSTSRGDVAWADWLSIAFTLLTLSVFVAFNGLAGRKLSCENRTAGALVAWLILTVLSACFVPRCHYFFAWPLLFSSFGFHLLLAEKSQRLAPWRLVVFCCSCLPGILLLVPGIYLIWITLGASRGGSAAICIVILLGLLTPHIELIVFGSRFQEMNLRAKQS